MSTSTNGASGHLEVYRDGLVGHVVMNRPEKRNAMTRAMVTGIAAGVRELTEAGGIEVIQLSSRGSAFCAGGDLGEAKGITLTHDSAWNLLQVGLDLVNTLENCPLLIITRVQGLAHGGGLLLALNSDLTIAGESAVFRAPELLVARPEPFIPPRLIARVGMERAADMMFTATPVGGRRAEQIGLVARCVPDDRLDAEVTDVIEAILRTDRESRTAWKKLLRRGLPAADPWAAVETFLSDQTADRAKAFVREPATT